MNVDEFKFIIFSALFVTLFSCSNAAKAKNDFLTRIDDTKEFKKFIKTHTNVLVIFSKTEKDFKDGPLVNKVAEEMKGSGSLVFVDCSNAMKLCKKLKTVPRSVEYKHFKNGEFHKVYDRHMTTKSMVRFMRDPTGDLPWQEDDSASAVTHLDQLTDLTKLLAREKKPILVMFYAPWCGFCKKLKPDYAAAASILLQEAVLAGMDVDTPLGATAKVEYNITGLPTIILFKDGQKEFDFGGENNKDGIVSWMRDPHPPKAKEEEKDWAEEESEVVHLTDASFDDVIHHGQSTLVMFYAPWCGHCKKMKPLFEDAALKVKLLEGGGVLGAVDGTKQKEVMEKFTISGFPTLKFFNGGKEEYDVQFRTSAEIVEFMKNPQRPVEKEAEAEGAWEDEDTAVVFLGQDDFKESLRKKKHSLVLFYTPWCAHCKLAKPGFMQAAEAFKDDNKRLFAAVDCAAQGQLCQMNGVQGYPHIVSYTYGKDALVYRGERQAKDFISFMKGPEATPASPPIKHLHWDDLENNQVVKILSSATFDDFIATHTTVVIAFYGAGCTHCHAMREAYIEAALQLNKENVEVQFAAVDAMAESALRKRLFLSALPSIKAFRNGVQLIEFDDIPRTKQNFVDFVKNPTAEATEYSAYRAEEGMWSIESPSLFQSSIKTPLFVFFHDPSNPQCLQARASFWASASEAGRLKVKLAIVDCVQLQGVCKRQAVAEVPSFKLYLDAAFHSDFKAPPSVQAFTDFLKQAVSVAKVEL